MTPQARHLNYQHLYYFWRVAAAGSISEAARELRLAQPTVSTQIKTLEDNLGESLFSRQGRTLSLTEAGKIAYRYAGEIFSLGTDFVQALEGQAPEGVKVLHIGITDALPKLLMYKLLKPLFESKNNRIAVYENRAERLLTELSVRTLDLVLSDAPLSPTFQTKTNSYYLGESGISFFASADLARKYRKDFPYSLAHSPMLIPTENAILRRSLDHWFNQLGIRPQVIGEFEDSALLRLFAKRKHGVFAAPSVIEKEIEEEAGVKLIGREESVLARFYAITVGNKLEDPAIQAICDTAERMIFSRMH